MSEISRINGNSKFNKTRDLRVRKYFNNCRKNYNVEMGRQLNVLTVLFILKNDQDIILYDNISDKVRWENRIFFPYGIEMEEILNEANKKLNKNYKMIEFNTTFNRKHLLNYYLLDKLDLIKSISSTERNGVAKNIPFFRIEYIKEFIRITGEDFERSKWYIDTMNEYFKTNSFEVMHVHTFSYHGFKALELKKIFQLGSPQLLAELREKYPSDILNDIVGEDEKGLLIDLNNSSITEEIPTVTESNNECTCDCN